MGIVDQVRCGNLSSSSQQEGSSKSMLWIVCVLMVFFGWSNWLFVNAVYVQMPLLGPAVPESWDIASHMSLAIQAGNIFPLTYLLLRWACRRVEKINNYGVVERTISARLTVVFILVVNVALAAILALYWNQTMDINGTEVSVFLIGGMFLAGGLSSLANLTYWSFGAKFKSAHIMSALSIGVGGSSIIPAAVGLIQNPGENPNFGVSAFFWIMFGFLFASFVGYVLSAYIRSFNVLKKDVMYLETDMVNVIETVPATGEAARKSKVVGSSSRTEESEAMTVESSADYGTSTRALNEDESVVGDSSCANEKFTFSGGRLTRYQLIIKHWPSFAVMLWISFPNFFLNGVLPYYAKAFGDDQQMVLRWITIAGMIASTVGRFSSSFFHTAPNSLLATVQSICFGLLFVFGSPYGLSSAALIICKSLLELCFSFNCTMLYKEASNLYITDSDQAQRICRYIAVFEQLGSITGTLTQFFLVQNGYMKG
eukprot:Nk52_evm77s1073 gene=Nk52_evmTU77s1073